MCLSYILPLLVLQTLTCQYVYRAAPGIGCSLTASFDMMQLCCWILKSRQCIYWKQPKMSFNRYKDKSTFKKRNGTSIQWNIIQDQREMNYQTIKGHRETWNALYKWKKPSKKTTYCISSTMWHSEKVKTVETVTFITSGYQGLNRSGLWWIDKAQRTFRAVKMLCYDTVMTNTCLYTFSKPQNVQYQK